MSKYTKLEDACACFLDTIEKSDWRVEGDAISSLDLLDALASAGLTLVEDPATASHTYFKKIAASVCE